MGKAIAVVAMVVLAIGSTVSYCAETSAATDGGRTVRNNDAGLALVLPAGWRRLPSTTASFGDDLQIRGQFGPGFLDDEDPAGCTKSDYTFVIVNVQEDKSASATPAVARPTRFTAESGGGVESGHAAQTCDSRSQYIRFTDRGRTFSAELGFGRDATRRRIAEGYDVLNSLRVRKA